MNSIDVFNKSMDSIEERIGELEDELEENDHTKAWEHKRLENRERSIRCI